MKKKLEYVIGIIGDDRLNFREIAARIEASSRILSDVSIQKRLTTAYKKGLLGRHKSKEAGRVYVYYRGDRDIGEIAFGTGVRKNFPVSSR